MKTFYNKIATTIFIAIIVFTIKPYVSLGQIDLDSIKIELPQIPANLGYSTDTPGDIIYANGKIYIYTAKKILVYNTNMSTCIGEVSLENEMFGRFALQFHNPDKYYADAKLMAHDIDNHKLYFVSPSLNIMSISTDSITTPQLEIPAPNNVYYSSLHGVTKLEYDNANDRLFWFFRSKESNLHSWGSYLGVFSNNGNWQTIYNEYIFGSGPNYPNLINTFAQNPQREDFYIGRKNRIQIWHIDRGGVASLEKEFNSLQERNGKMLVIENSSINRLLVFPYAVGYDDNLTRDDQIYQISTDTTYAIDSTKAPSKLIIDALFMPGNSEIMMCYANDTTFVQIDTSNNHDLCTMSFANNKFQNPQTLYTQSSGEPDTSYNCNLNRPFKLTISYDSSVLVSKKNEVVKIDYSSSTGYSASNLYYARDNHFGKGIDVFGKTIILNSLFGIDFFFEGLTEPAHGQRHLTFPAFNTEYNPLSRKMYIFNRLTTDNTGFFIYDLEGEMIETFVEVDKPIGDLKFNAARNEVLVSQFNKDEGLGAVVNVFDAITGDLQQTLSFSGKNYAGRMFVSPNGKIYISLNMKDDDSVPEIEIMDADDYTPITSGTLDITGLTDTKFSYTLQSHFCYNPYNDMVYATIAPYDHVFPPYQTSYNSSQLVQKDPTSNTPDDSIAYSPYENSPGKLVAINSGNSISWFKNIDSPSELICTTPDLGKDPGYAGTLFINSGKNKDSELLSFDCATETFNTAIDLNRLFDIEYCPLTNCTYVLNHIFIVDSNVYNANQSLTEVYKVLEDGTKYLVWQKHGFASSISYNPYDSRLYIYYRNGERFLGDSYTKIFTLDPFADTLAVNDSITLPFRNLNPEVVPQANHPHFDPYNNKAYFPNGMHSSVSIVGFESKEALVLGKDTDWLSIPRLPSNSTTNWDEKDTTSIVWDRNNFETPYTEIKELYHWHTYATGEGPLDVSWNLNTWTYVPDVDSNKFTWSVRGYQLDVLPDGDNYIYMTGNIKDPATSFPLYNGKKNWVGYFLPGEQDIFDALGASTLENLSNIKHRDFYCYRGPAIEGPTGGIVNGYPWRCDQQQTNIAYGDMVQLKVNGNIADFDMIWQNPGSTPRDKIRPEPSHFEFAEAGTYTPILIELDYTNNPLEIGAFVDDSCMGAESVMESDTVIILRAYLNGGSPDSVVFQDWDGTKSAGRIIKDYTVYNPNTGIYENRALMSNTDEEMPRISFRKRNKEKENGLVDHKIGVWPNPTANVLNYSFACEDKTDVKVALLDVSGRQIKLLLDQRFSKGFYQRTAMLGSSISGHLTPGVYFVRFDIGGYIETKKLVIN